MEPRWVFSKRLATLPYTPYPPSVGRVGRVLLQLKCICFVNVKPDGMKIAEGASWRTYYGSVDLFGSALSDWGGDQPELLLDVQTDRELEAHNCCGEQYLRRGFL